MVFRDPDTEIISDLLTTASTAISNIHTKNTEKEAAQKIRRWQWARPQVEGICPVPRGGHTATLVGPLDTPGGTDKLGSAKAARIVIFGGHAGGSNDGGGDFDFFNDVFVLDVDENTWKKPRCRGTPPDPRYGHSASLVGGRIVYFGGKGNKTHFRDLHALDMHTMTWYQGPASCGAPIARHGHTSTLYDGRIFVFGGVCENFLYFDGAQSLDLSSMAWRDLPTTGPKPTARMGHSAILVDKHLLIFGGFALSKQVEQAMVNCGTMLHQCYLNDVRVFDLETYTWSRLRTHGIPPPGRYGHSMVSSDNDIICFGGWAGVNKCQLCGVINDKGAQHHYTCPTRNTMADKPSAGFQTADYCYVLRTKDMTWEQLSFTGAPASSRYGHSMTAIGPHALVFGGWDGGKSLNDLIVLRDRGERGETGELKKEGDPGMAISG